MTQLSLHSLRRDYQIAKARKQVLESKGLECKHPLQYRRITNTFIWCDYCWYFKTILKLKHNPAAITYCHS